MIAVPGSPEPARHYSMAGSAELFKRELLAQAEAGLRFHRLIQVMQLRRSCGVGPFEGTVSVRVPSRYAKGI